MTRDERRTAAVVAAVGTAVLLVLAAVLVPWDPVPGAAPAPLAAGEVFTAAQVERAEGFSSWARVLRLGSLATALAVAAWFGFSGRGRALTARLRGPWPLQALQAVALVLVAGRLVTLPFAVLLHRHLREHGLSTQGWAGFAADLVKTEVVQVLTTTLAVVAVMACARTWRRVWPAVAACVVGVLVLGASFVHPLVVEPLFSSFAPLPEGELRTRVLQVAAAEGVDVGEVLVSDASRRTTTVNAYVSGFGGTRRVVLYDTLVADLPQDQALAVVAHELAHARHDDVLVGSVLGAVGAGSAVGLLGVVLGGLRRRGGSVREPAVVPVVLALVALGTVLASPLENAVSRRIETRADVDALRTTGDAQAFVELQRQLMLRSLTDPTPPGWAQLWFGSHPTGLQRMALARSVAGATDGRPAPAAQAGWPQAVASMLAAG